MFKRIAIPVVIALVCLAWGLSDIAHALPTQGTTAGTVITAVSTNLQITYQDSNSNIQPTVNANQDVTTNVSAIYGLDKSGFSPILSQATSAGGVVGYTLYFRNVANITDTVSFNYNTVSINYQGNYGGNWNLSPLSTPYQSLSEFAVATVSFTVTASGTAQNGSKAFVTVNAITERTPAGTYTGFNTNTYGGPPTLNYVTTTTISGPDVIILTKTVLQTIAPTGTGYGGLSTDVVPGSKIVYQVVLSNLGTTADVTVLEQSIPKDTDYLQGSMVITNTGGSGINGVKDFFTSSYHTDNGTTTNATVGKIRFKFDQFKNNGYGNVTLNYTVVVK